MIPILYGVPVAVPFVVDTRPELETITELLLEVDTELDVVVTTEEVDVCVNAKTPAARIIMTTTTITTMTVDFIVGLTSS